MVMAAFNMSTFTQDLKAWAKDKSFPVEAIYDPTDRSTVSAYLKIGEIYNKVVDWLNTTNHYGTESMNNVFCVEKEQMNSMLPNQNHSYGTSYDELYALAKDCGTPDNMMAVTMSNMQRIISQYTNRTAITDHWMSGSEQFSGQLLGMESFYPQAALADMSMSRGTPGFEAFGATVDTVIPDLRMALTVVLIKPHKGVMSRLIQRRTLAGAVITYVITRNELYDLQKSQEKDAYVRNSYSHRHNLVELYRRPDPTDMSLTRMEPLKANDDDGVLVDDNIIKFNTSLNLFNMVLDEKKAYRNRFNYTDLVSEGVLIDKIYVQAKKSDDSITEVYVVPVSELARARLMHLQTSEQYSGDRETTLIVAVPCEQNLIDNNTGQKTKLFESVEMNIEYIQLIVKAYVKCDLITANVTSMGNFEVRAVAAKAGTEPSETVKNVLKDVKFELIGYELDARYSEENLRQLDRAARSLTYVISVEMPQGKTITVDFSMQQTMPEQVMNVAQELQAIGIDHRNTQMFLKTMRSVHDECVKQRNDELYNEHSDGKGVNRQFVSGQQVNPEIFMGTIDLAQVVNAWSSNMAGDIRQHVDSYITKALSIVHYRSQYLTQLDSNKVPTYKVLTSSPILENLLALPHVYEHMMPNGMNAERLYKEKNPGEPIEYTRTLMSGVKLEVITSAFYYLEDKMIFFPYVDGDPSNVLNFAHNWDLGQFVANYTPVDNNQVNRRVFMNTREWPIITCPVGAIITVKNLEQKLPNLLVG